MPDTEEPPAKVPNWRAIQLEYESSGIPHRKLAAKHGIPYKSTLSKHAMRDGWSQRGRLIQKTARKLESNVNEAIKQEIRDELAPFIAAERAKITKRGVEVANRGLSRLEKLWAQAEPEEAKQEADGARTAEILVRLARTSLGMNDGAGLGGALSLNILTNQAAIQVVASGPVESTDPASDSQS